MPRGRSRSASPPRHRHRRNRSRSRSPPRSEPRRSRHRSRSRRHTMPKKKDRIPDNWVDVAKMGTLVGASRFVPLRVPLDGKYLPQFQRISDEVWAPSDFLEAQETQNLNVKMIIDLTNTLKYYNGVEEFKDSAVRYVKLRIEGFNGPPAARDVAKFMEIVDEFVEKEPEGAIAVHCTHGLNRTGYLIVNYLVERMGLSVTQALEAFKLARPPGLIKHMYVEELYQRLGKEDEEVQLPELPDWARAKYGKRANKDDKRGGHGNRGKREGSGRRGNRDNGKDDNRDSRENRDNADDEGERHDRASKHGRRGKRDSRDSRENADELGEGEQYGRRNTHRGSDKRGNRCSREKFGAHERSESERGASEKEKHSTHLRFEAEVD